MRVLASISNLGGVSDSSLSAIVGSLGDANFCTLQYTSPRTIGRSQDYVLDHETPYGTAMQETHIAKRNGRYHVWSYVNPAALLNLLARESTQFNDLLWATCQSTPPSPDSPWEIIAYEDEVSSGNVLRVDQTRKCGAFYWSFVQFGYEVLSHVSGWMLGGVIRAKNVKDISGGLSAVMAFLIQSFFGAEHDFSTGGVQVRLRQATVTIFAKLSICVADEDALRAIWTVKGFYFN